MKTILICSTLFIVMFANAQDTTAIKADFTFYSKTKFPLIGKPGAKCRFLQHCTNDIDSVVTGVISIPNAVIDDKIECKYVFIIDEDTVLRKVSVTAEGKHLKHLRKKALKQFGTPIQSLIGPGAKNIKWEWPDEIRKNGRLTFVFTQNRNIGIMVITFLHE